VLTEAEREARIQAFTREEKAIEAEERRLEEEQERRRRELELKRQRKALRRKQRRLKQQQKASRFTRYYAIASTAALLMFLAYAYLVPPLQKPIATLTGGVDMKWDNSDLPTESDSLLRPGQMKLLEGVAAITLNEGAQLFVEGPAEINLKSGNRAFLKSGKLAANVPAETRGFTVDTPSSSTVDLGTEFAIHVKEDGTSDLHVFKGKVALLAGKISEEINGLNGNGAKEQIVKAGQAKRVKAGSSRINDIQFGQTAFVRNIPSPYELAIRRSKPVAYWRFDESSEESDRSIQYFGDSAIEPLGPGLGDGKPNNGLKLNGKNGHVLAKDMAPNWAQTGFSLVLWVRPDAIARQNIIVNADQDGPFAHYSRQLFINSQGKFAFWILAWEPELGEVEGEPVTLTSSTVPQPGKWYHVAVTVGSNGDMRLFINGSEENALLLVDLSLHVNPQRDRIYIGSSACGELDDRELMRSFAGGLDEIARYNRVLSPKEIERLYRSAGQ
jgi:ferric-dicitrate binding protein FerR (iron transport regulator)